MAAESNERERVLSAADRLFDAQGPAAVTMRDVADESGVSTRVIGRHFADVSALFAEVVARRAASPVAERMAEQARTPAEPALGVLLWAAREIFAAPERNWGTVELEAFLAARRDDALNEVVRERIAQRWTSMDGVVRHMRESGTIDDAVDDDALVHFSLALSAGLALVDPVVPSGVGEREWTALMSRLLTALGPSPLQRRSPIPTGPLWRVRVDVPDRVGAMEDLARALTALDAFVATATTPGDGPAGWHTLDLLITCPETLGVSELRETVAAVGRHVYVRAGHESDRVDVATRVLDGVTGIVLQPLTAPDQVARLVEADSVDVIDATEGDDDSSGVLRLQWTPTRHVVLRREWAPFIAAERSRASAAMRLAAAMAASAGIEEAQGWLEVLRNGQQVWMRLARPEDSAAVTAMHERCSERTIHQRYFRNVTEWRELTMRRLSGGHRGASIVVMAEDGQIIGLGNVFPLSDDSASESEQSRMAEIALLIDDAHQGLGIGGRLLTHMLNLAQRLGFDAVEASVLAENRSMVALLDRTGLTWSRQVESGITEFIAPLN